MEKRKCRMSDVGCRSAMALVLAIGVTALGCNGCGQQQRTDTEQTPDQRVVTPTKTEQDSAAQGAQYYVYVQTAPQAGGGNPAPTSQPGSELQQVLATVNQAGAARIASGGQTNVAVVSIGSSATTPTLTGTTSGSGTGTQTPSQTGGAVSANQEPRANVTASGAFGMPGSAPSANASGAAEGGTSTATQTNQQTAQATQIRAMQDRIAQLEALAARLSATTQPAAGDGTGGS